MPKTSAWGSTVPIAVPGTGTQIIEYPVPNNAHVLVRSSLILTIPQVSVKPEHSKYVRIRFTQNLAHALIKSASFEVNGTPWGQPIDNNYMDFASQMLQRSGAGKADGYDFYSGNKANLVEPTSVIQADEITIRVPWSYMFSPQCAFHCLYLDDSVKANHKIKFRLDLVNLIVGEIFTNDEWKLIPTANIGNYIESAKMTLHHPNMICHMHKVDTETFETLTADCNIKVREINIRTIIPLHHKATFSSGGTVDINIDLQDPCVALFWGGENTSALAHNSYGNFTTNFADESRGRHSIKMQDLSVDGESIFSQMPSIVFCSTYPYENFPSVPRRTGLNCFPFVENVGDINGEAGTILRGAKLTLYFENADHKRGEIACQYRPLLYAMVTKKVTITATRIDNKVKWTYRIHNGVSPSAAASAALTAE